MSRVLIVDDDYGLYALLNDYLGSFGFSCAHAPDGDAGVAALSAEPWDAVVLDIMLPGKNGHEVLARLRADPATAALPVLMLTARGGEDDRVRGLESGADDYLPKPFSPKELVARLNALIRIVERSGTAAAGGQEKDEALTLDDLVIEKASMSLIRGETRTELTASELRLLEIFAEAPGRIVDRETLYMKLFNHPPFGQDRSLDMTVSRLRKKIGPRRDGGERIRAARGQGYIFLLSGEPQ